VPRNLVINEGVLAEKIVTESHQPIELAQLEAEVTAHEETVRTLTEQLEALITQKTDAEAALEDCKSDVQTAKGLVEAPVDGAEGTTEDGDGEPTEDSESVSIPVVQY
jgi:hypothetical protein